MDKLEEQITQLPTRFGLWGTLLELGISLAIIFVIFQVAYLITKRFLRNRDYEWIPLIRQYIYSPLLICVMLTTIHSVTAGEPAFAVRPLSLLHKLIYIAIVIAYAVLLIRGLKGLRLLTVSRIGAIQDTIKLKRITTQARVVERILGFFIIIVALAIILMSFEAVKRIGVSMLASAGLAGIIIGFSAQKTIATIFASIQIALAQPIRIDDVVVVEGEYGRITEISLTHVIVTIWDQRQIILPITYFIEKPFINYTRADLELLGTAFIYTDHTINVQKLREAALEFVHAYPDWDQRVATVAVTNLTDQSVEIRVLVSISDLTKMFDFRTSVREFLLGHIQEQQPEALPRTRIEVPITGSQQPPTSADVPFLPNA